MEEARRARDACYSTWDRFLAGCSGWRLAVYVLAAGVAVACVVAVVLVATSQARGAPRLGGLFAAGIGFRSPIAERFSGGGAAGSPVCRIVGGGRVTVGSPEDAVAALAASGFAASLDSVNLTARGARDAADYAKRYAGSLTEATAEDARALREAGVVLDRVFGETADPLVRLAATGGDVRVVLSSGTGAEGGLAHTLGRVVVLPRSALSESSASLAALLAHELVHVAQRTNPRLHSGRARALGWSGDSPAIGADPQLPLPARANPDTSTTGAVLAGRGGALCGAFFSRGTQASDLQEVQIACLTPAAGEGGAEPRYSASPARYEHPNEETAYLVQEAVRRHADTLEAAGRRGA